jgi:hypothetical protein
MRDPDLLALSAESTSLNGVVRGLSIIGQLAKSSTIKLWSTKDKESWCATFLRVITPKLNLVLVLPLLQASLKATGTVCLLMCFKNMQDDRE